MSSLLTTLRKKDSNTLWQPSDLLNLANTYDPEAGITLGTSPDISDWNDQQGSDHLSMDTVNNRPHYVEDQLNGRAIIDAVADGFGKVLTLDGGLTNHPQLTALSGNTGYLAMLVYADSTLAAGATIGLGSGAGFDGIFLHHSAGKMFVPGATNSALIDVGASPIPTNTWGVFTANWRADDIVYRWQGADVHTINSGKNYGFDRFAINRRTASNKAVGNHKFGYILTASDGVSDADNLYVEGWLAALGGI